MANQDGSFQYIGYQEQDPKAMLDAMPEPVLISNVAASLNESARDLYMTAMAAATYDRAISVAQERPAFRDALLSIARAAEQALLLLQQALLTGEPLDDDTSDSQMGPLAIAVNEHIEALKLDLLEGLIEDGE